ncbi:MAG: MBL fold metallo-hydrolase [Dehalococcoidales bacterium]|nr:MBL fold metallo-hydrolase [Dehalococcoidales bacterium]
MKVKWLGHASFMITSDNGTRIITDPYITNERLTYDEIDETADIVTVSHEHGDHNNVAAVKGNPEVVRGAAKVKGIEFESIPTYHDDGKGEARGSNTIFCFEVDGVKVCHLGDLGHPLDDKQVADLGKVDVMLTPVGGSYTIDAKVATQICDRLNPKVIIPMHFQNDKCAFPIAGVDEFLKGKKDINQLDTSEVDLVQGELPITTTIIVLEPAL